MRDGRTTWKRRSLPALRAQRRVLRVVWSPDRGAIGRALELDGTTWTIGREGEGLGRVADRTMSRKHARLVPHASKLGYMVEDLGGSNGTFLDGRRVKKPEVLSTHAVLAIGETVWCLDAEPEPDDLPIVASIDAGDGGELVGVSLAAERLRKAAASAGSTRGAVLLLGPSGVGKDVMARELHRHSGREPFVAVNCATIAPELADSHLFGHHKGAFTGADRERGGLFRRASGGTLFLDEVGELPAAVQAKLLRTLEAGVIEPVGADAPVAVDVRIVAATNRDVTQPGFRADLYARLADWVFHVPPLLERRADVVPLLLRFLGGARSLTADFVEALLLHDWPLNVRELQKLAQRLALTVPAELTLDLEHLPRALVDPIAGRDEPPPEGEREPPAVAVLEQALRRAKGNVKQAADDHGWHRTQLYRWLRRAGIDPESFRE
jgi:DNA-binding NtrC family response regulator